MFKEKEIWSGSVYESHLNHLMNWNFNHCNDVQSREWNRFESYSPLFFDLFEVKKRFKPFQARSSLYLYRFSKLVPFLVNSN